MRILYTKYFNIIECVQIFSQTVSNEYIPDNNILAEWC